MCMRQMVPGRDVRQRSGRSIRATRLIAVEGAGCVEHERRLGRQHLHSQDRHGRVRLLHAWPPVAEPTLITRGRPYFPSSSSLESVMNELMVRSHSTIVLLFYDGFFRFLFIVNKITIQLNRANNY